MTISKKKPNPFAKAVLKSARDLAKASPKKIHRVLFDAFEVVAATGDVARTTTLIDWMYGRAPAPTDVATVLSTHAIDGICAAAKLGDRTRGLPKTFTGPVRGELSARVAAAETMVRKRLLTNSYVGELPTDDGWQSKPARDPFREIDRWRRIQALAAGGSEKAALERIERLLEAWAPDARGPGHGDELIVALDLALRHGEESTIPGWLARHGARFANESFLIQTAFCLPAIAAFVVRGGLRDVIGLSDGELADAMDALDAALAAAGTGPAKGERAPKVQKRRVLAEFSQVHLGPETRSDAEKEQMHFQNKTDNERGMSLFPTMVGIATPTDTDYVDAEITLSSDGVDLAGIDLSRVAQAVAFPIEVRGPIVLTSASVGDEDPLSIPTGSYDVLARFVAKKAPKASAEAGLRVFTLALSFHPAGSLAAPKTLKLAG